MRLLLLLFMTIFIISIVHSESKEIRKGERKDQIAVEKNQNRGRKQNTQNNKKYTKTGKSKKKKPKKNNSKKRKEKKRKSMRKKMKDKRKRKKNKKQKFNKRKGQKSERQSNTTCKTVECLTNIVTVLKIQRDQVKNFIKQNTRIGKRLTITLNKVSKSNFSSNAITSLARYDW